MIRRSKRVELRRHHSVNRCHDLMAPCGNNNNRPGCISCAPHEALRCASAVNCAATTGRGRGGAAGLAAVFPTRHATRLCNACGGLLACNCKCAADIFRCHLAPAGDAVSC